MESVNEIYKYSITASVDLNAFQMHNVDEISQLYDILEDDKSKKVLESTIKRIFDTKNSRSIMLELFDDNQYFPEDVVNLSEHECFVDVGAYTGDTLESFYNNVNGKFDHYYAFELDKKFFNALQDSMNKFNAKNNVKLFPVGLWDKKACIKYNSGDSDSTIGTGEIAGYVDKLDDILSKEKISFIKMDIEGAELNALKGAENIIKEQKPTLAICVYHSFKDLWEIPLYIKSLVPEYKIYLRHHTRLDYETVCYAIPRNKTTKGKR